MSPDPDNAGASADDPQSWNAYAYARNNPSTFTDADGRTCTRDKKGNFHGDTCEQDTGTGDSPQVVTVTPSAAELNLLMLQSLGDTLSSPRQWADLTKNALENTTPGGMIAGAIEQCALATCNKTDIAMAALPFLPLPELGPIAEEIANGHAFEKHATELGVASKADLKALIEHIIENADAANDVRRLRDGRVAFWDDTKKAVPIYNPNGVDKGTILVPTQGRY